MHVPPLILLSPLIASVSAFFPTKFRPGLTNNPGVSHEQITEDAFDAVAKAWFPVAVGGYEDVYGLSLSPGMLRAREVISKATALVESSTEYQGSADPDDYQMTYAAWAELQVEIVDNLEAGFFGPAQLQVGRALHTIQEYIYVHRDGPGDLELPFLAKRGCWSLESTNRGDLECHSYDGKDYSGKPAGVEQRRYNYRIKRREQISPVSDGSAPSDADADAELVELAKFVSEKFIFEIGETASQRQLQQLFGLGLDTKILIDPLAIMSPQWSDAEAQLEALFESFANEDPGDKDVRFGTVEMLDRGFRGSHGSSWVPLRDMDISDIILDFQSKIFEIGRFACENTSLAEPLSAIRSLGLGGEIILITGESAERDEYFEGEIARLLTVEPVAVTVMHLHSVCSPDHTIDDVYQHIADFSDGIYLHDIANYPTLAATQEGDMITPSKMGSIFKQSQLYPGDDPIAFSVDADMDKIIITADMYPMDHPSNLVSSGPDGTVYRSAAQKTDQSTYTFSMNIDAPLSGTWLLPPSQFVMENITIQGRSPIHLVGFSIVETVGEGEHAGFFPVENPPPADVRIGLIGQLYGRYSGAVWFLSDAATGEKTELALVAGLDPLAQPGFADNQTYFGIEVLPESPFYLVVQGEDSHGQRFQRTFPDMISPMYYPNKTFEIDGIDGVLPRRSVPGFIPPSREGLKFGLAQQNATTSVVGMATGTAAGAGDAGSLSTASPFWINSTAFPTAGTSTVEASTAVSMVPSGIVPAISTKLTAFPEPFPASFRLPLPASLDSSSATLPFMPVPPTQSSAVSGMEIPGRVTIQTISPGEAASLTSTVIEMETSTHPGAGASTSTADATEVKATRSMVSIPSLSSATPVTNATSVPTTPEAAETVTVYRDDDDIPVVATRTVTVDCVVTAGTETTVLACPFPPVGQPCGSCGKQTSDADAQPGSALPSSMSTSVLSEAESPSMIPPEIPSAEAQEQPSPSKDTQIVLVTITKDASQSVAESTLAKPSTDGVPCPIQGSVSMDAETVLAVPATVTEVKTVEFPADKPLLTITVTKFRETSRTTEVSAFTSTARAVRPCDVCGGDAQSADAQGHSFASSVNGTGFAAHHPPENSSSAGGRARATTGPVTDGAGGVRAGIIAVVAVAVGGSVFLIL